jgi:hypothetical protein
MWPFLEHGAGEAEVPADPYAACRRTASEIQLGSTESICAWAGVGSTVSIPRASAVWRVRSDRERLTIR